MLHLACHFDTGAGGEINSKCEKVSAFVMFHFVQAEIYTEEKQMDIEDFFLFVLGLHVLRIFFVSVLCFFKSVGKPTDF